MLDGFSFTATISVMTGELWKTANSLIGESPSGIGDIYRMGSSRASAGS